MRRLALMLMLAALGSGGGCAERYCWEGERIGAIENGVYRRESPHLVVPTPQLPDDVRCTIRTFASSGGNTGGVEFAYGENNGTGIYYRMLAPEMARSLAGDKEFRSRQLKEIETALNASMDQVKTVDRREDFGLFLITPATGGNALYRSFYGELCGSLWCVWVLEHPAALFSGNDTEIANYFYRRMRRLRSLTQLE